MKKKWLTVMIVCIALMFGWIFLAVALTGGREPVDFTQQDKLVMTAFAVVELLTVAVMIIAACMLGREVGRAMPKVEPVSLTKAEKVRRRTGAVLMWVPLLLALAANIGGVLLWKRNDAWVTSGAKWICGMGYLIGIVVLPMVSVLAAKLRMRHYQNMSVSEANQFVLSHREQAERTAQRKLGQLRSLRLATNVYALVLFLLGLFLAVLSGYLYQSDTFSVPRVFGAAFLMAAAAQQIVMAPPKEFLEEIDGFLPEEDYPRLYELAHRAAEETGWRGPVRLYLMPMAGAVVGQVRGVLCLRLGAPTVGILTQEELYAIFLHEFTHEAAENRQINREVDYFTFLSQGRSPNALSTLTSFYYCYLDNLYDLTFELYRFAATIGIETRTDEAMAKHPEAAASSLLKLKYYDLYLWEGEARDDDPAWQGALPPEHIMGDELAGFLKALPWRREDWNAITKKEIRARNATHPTTWERIRALGFAELPETGGLPDGDYGCECSRAIALLDGRMQENMTAYYDDSRRENYVEPLERVNAWEAAGCPVTAERYADLVEDLRRLSRISDAERLCDRAVAELSPAAAGYACFVRGTLRLHRYQEAGLEDLYTAIAGNSNYIDEGLNLIGTFCCMMGLQEELDAYRQKALELAQRQRDEFSQLDTLTRRDQLSQEHLPEGMLEGILSYIGGISQDSIEKIFLVRKTISDRFFTSAFVIRFLPETSEETKQEVLHQIFRYLDTSTDWQFSLFDEADVPKGLAERVENSCVFEK